jgi:uncharacterized protein (TIGR03086 family)
LDELIGLGRAEQCWQSALDAAHGVDVAKSSSCDGWSIADLIGHVNGGGHRYLLLIEGAPLATVEATRNEDYLTPDPVLRFHIYEDPLRRAFADRSRWERQINHRAGPRSIRTLLLMRELELTLHGWDLLDSVGATTCIDEDLATLLLAEAMPIVDELRALDMYKPARARATGSAGQRLIAATGRHPTPNALGVHRREMTTAREGE